MPCKTPHLYCVVVLRSRHVARSVTKRRNTGGKSKKDVTGLGWFHAQVSVVSRRREQRQTSSNVSAVFMDAREERSLTCHFGLAQAVQAVDPVRLDAFCLLFVRASLAPLETPPPPVRRPRGKRCLGWMWLRRLLAAGAAARADAPSTRRKLGAAGGGQREHDATLVQAAEGGLRPATPHGPAV